MILHYTAGKVRLIENEKKICIYDSMIVANTAVNFALTCSNMLLDPITCILRNKYSTKRKLSLACTAYHRERHTDMRHTVRHTYTHVHNELIDYCVTDTIFLATL